MAEPSASCSLITTVRNEAGSIGPFIESILSQSRPPDEIVILDGGSTDGTAEAIQAFIDDGAPIRLIVDAEANIARGRNLAVGAAAGPVIAATDAGCRLTHTWLERLIAPLIDDPDLDVSSGFYEIDPQTFFERVNGMLTLPGQLAPVDPEAFLPSGRSVAFRKGAWERAGGYPEWLYAAEDTLFDRKLKRLGCRFRFEPEAIVYWRPRTSWRAFARQFFIYGVGSGRTGGFSAGYWYTIRQHLVTTLLVVLAIVEPWAWIAVGLWQAYYLIFSLAPQARQVKRKLGSLKAGLLALVLIEVRRLAGATGFLIGTVQRWTRPGRYRRPQREYMSGEGLS